MTFFRLHRKRSAILTFLGIALAACSTSKPVQDRPVTIKVPVHVPCALPRPTAPIPLSQRSDWYELDVRQKAALVGKQGLEWQEYGQQLNAATAACP